MTRRVPNFLIVGAPKAGTTSLYWYLSQHPDIYVSPVKEPCFFAPELQAVDPRIIVNWHEYLKLFSQVRGEHAIGEASVAYLSSPGAPSAIAERLPRARILMMLRDPADRLFSHYVAARTAGATKAAFLSWVERQAELEAIRDPPVGPIGPGRYATHLKRYLDIFPARQVRAFLFDDYVKAPGRVVAGALEFLGVDPSAPIDVGVRRNVTTTSRWPRFQTFAAPLARKTRAVMPATLMAAVKRWTHKPVRLRATAREREHIIGLYRDEIDRLEHLLGRDLSSWRAARRRR
jgi:hypothetical protein